MNEEQRAFAAAPNIAVFASVDGKGRPHATPVWYLLENGDIFRISVARGGQKHRNVQRNPDVTLVIDKRELPPYALMISGTAKIGPAMTDDERLLLAVRYLGEALGKSYVEMTAAEESVTLILHPRKVAEFDPRKRP